MTLHLQKTNLESYDAGGGSKAMGGMSMTPIKGADGREKVLSLPRCHGREARLLCHQHCRLPTFPQEPSRHAPWNDWVGISQLLISNIKTCFWDSKHFSNTVSVSSCLCTVVQHYLCGVSLLLALEVEWRLDASLKSLRITIAIKAKRQQQIWLAGIAQRYHLI